jgi:hypothetical protein
MWLALVLSFIFDTAFVGKVVQRIFGVGRESFVLYYLAYLPGIAIALCLLGAGTLLAVSLFRRRELVSRRRCRPRLTVGVLLRRIWVWRPQPQTRQVDDLPWPRVAAPLLLTLAILVLLGVAAYIRAAYSAHDLSFLASFMPVFVVLLVLVGIAAILMTVLSHNPHADSAKEAAVQLRKAEKKATSLLTDARRKVAAHAEAHGTLRTLVKSTENQVWHIIEEVCVRILEDRGRRGSGGQLQLPLATLRWPRVQTDDSASPAYPKRSLPRLHLEIFASARKVLRRYRPKQLERKLAKAADGLNAQFVYIAPDGSG